MEQQKVLEVYRITLLSNQDTVVVNELNSFRGLQNYTTLKPTLHHRVLFERFRGLQNYTTLKPQIKFEAQE